MIYFKEMLMRNRVKEACKDNNITMEHLALMLGITKSYLSKVLNEKN